MESLVGYESDGESQQSSRNTPVMKVGNEDSGVTSPLTEHNASTKDPASSQAQLDAEWEKFLDETTAVLLNSEPEPSTSQDTTDCTERKMSISESESDDDDDHGHNDDDDDDDSHSDNDKQSGSKSDHSASRSPSPPVLEPMTNKNEQKKQKNDKKSSPIRKRSRSRSRSRKRSKSPHRKRRSRSRSASRRHRDRRRRSRSRDRKRRRSLERSRSRRSNSRSRHRRSRSRNRNDRKNKRGNRSRRRRPRSRSKDRRSPSRRNPAPHRPAPGGEKPAEFVDFKTKMRMELQRAAREALEGKTVVSQSSTSSIDIQSQLASIKQSIAAGVAGGKITPQQALLQSMAAMHQKAQELTGVAVPKYYNPAAVNPLKYAEQVSKRKLLWSKAKDNKEENKTQWQSSAAMLNKDEDGKEALKFKKLMGMKDDGSSGTESVKVSEEQRKRQEELFNQLDREYEFARLATHTHRGVGLGMLTSQPTHQPK